MVRAAKRIKEENQAQATAAAAVVAWATDVNAPAS
jgi:hypothetical protein